MARRDLRQMKNDKQKATLSKQDIQEMARKANIKADIGNVDNGDIQNMQQTISKYENKSEGELMGELEKAINSGRKDGSFSDDMLEKFMKNVAPMMDSNQRKKLDSIARTIKKRQ